MPTSPVTRKLTTILYADVVGYSRLTGDDEEGTHRAVMRVLDFTRDTVEGAGGTVLRYAGDAILAEFASVVSCVDAAVAVQTEFERRNEDVAEQRRVRLRIGINLGEVLQDRGEIYGDGVNVAARLEALAPAGGICITGRVAEQIAGKSGSRFGDAGRHRLKNIDGPIDIWCWPPRRARAMRRAAAGRRIPALAAALLVALAGGGYMLARDAAAPARTIAPRIAVIPFEEQSTAADGGYFGYGLTRDINAYLSKFTNLFVLAPSAVSALGGRTDCRTIRDEIGADYVLEGGVRRSGGKLRVTTTLTDTATCRQLDAPGPYDRTLDVADVLDVQLDIARSVAAQIGSADAPLFNASVQSAIRHRAPESIEAYECVLLSFWFYENFDPQRHRRARACLENTVATDADYSLGWSRLAFSYIESQKYKIDPPPDWSERSRAAANRAVALDPDNPDAYYALAVLTQMTSHDFAQFRSFAERAIELNPNDAFVLADLGTWMGYAGEWDRAKEWVSRSMQLNPKHQGWLYQTWHLDHFRAGEYAKSRDMALKMNLPGNYMVQASLTAAYAMNGEQGMAAKTLAHLLELRPDYAEDPRAPFRDRGMPADLVEGLMQGLRRAGLAVAAATAIPERAVLHADE